MYCHRAYFPQHADTLLLVRSIQGFLCVHKSTNLIIHRLVLQSDSVGLTFSDAASVAVRATGPGSRVSREAGQATKAWLAARSSARRAGHRIALLELGRCCSWSWSWSWRVIGGCFGKRNRRGAGGARAGAGAGSSRGRRLGIRAVGDSLGNLGVHDRSILSFRLGSLVGWYI